MAAAGVDITGVELSAEMLDLARRHAASLPAAAMSRITLRQGDMRDLSNLSGPFRLVNLPYRTFQHLLTPEDQRATLTGFGDLLAPGGRLILNQFDPTLDIAAILQSPPPPDADVESLPVDTEFTDDDSGRRIRVRYRRGYDLAQQLLQQEFYYQTLDEGGAVVDTERGQLTLRYTFRYEMEWLLAACGFRVLSLSCDFDGGPYPGYGEQVWVVEKV